MVVGVEEAGVMRTACAGEACEAPKKPMVALYAQGSDRGETQPRE